MTRRAASGMGGAGGGGGEVESLELANLKLKCLIRKNR